MLGGYILMFDSLTVFLKSKLFFKIHAGCGLTLTIPPRMRRSVWPCVLLQNLYILFSPTDVQITHHAPSPGFWLWKCELRARCTFLEVDLRVEVQ